MNLKPNNPHPVLIGFSVIAGIGASVCLFFADLNGAVTGCWIFCLVWLGLTRFMSPLGFHGGPIFRYFEWFAYASFLSYAVISYFLPPRLVVFFGKIDAVIFLFFILGVAQIQFRCYRINRIFSSVDARETDP